MRLSYPELCRRSVVPEKIASNNRIGRAGRRAAHAQSDDQKQDAVHDIWQEYELQKRNDWVNQHTYTFLIRALGNAGEINRALECYQQACSDGFQDRYVNAEIIRALQRAVQTDTIAFYTLFHFYDGIVSASANCFEKTDSFFFSYAIVAANWCEKWRFARAIYDEARKRKQVSSHVQAMHAVTQAKNTDLYPSPLPTYAETMCQPPTYDEAVEGLAPVGGHRVVWTHNPYARPNPSGATEFAHFDNMAIARPQ